ncbi:MAG: UDP-N-acetylmuramate--L-alanine ligase [Syntrophobacteraceae bacterium]
MTENNEHDIYMLGIGGIAMGTLATMLKEKGYRVSGSDLNLYPPMSTHLESLGIPIFHGYAAENLIRSEKPDFAVIGNVIRKDNPEAQYVLESGIPYLSMPEAISRFFLCDHESIVVAGTHGKSTTSSLLAWVLTSGGLDPSAFIGAFVRNWDRSYRLGKGRYMVLEGDEYDTAFFDKGPKFLHYRPSIGLITSIEFDHADIFADFDAVYRAFQMFVQLVPPDGNLIVNADDVHCVEVGRECPGRFFTYGRSPGADWRMLDISCSPGEVRFTYVNGLNGRRESISSRLPGPHNAFNTLAVTAAASLAGMSHESIQEAVLSFKGVKRRQEVLGECNGVLVIDDFAHHPTAVRETVHALRLFYPDRRLIAIFEPRTNSSRRNVFQNDYALAFDEADCVCIKEPPGMDAIPEAERLNALQLVHDIDSRRKECHYFTSAAELQQFLLEYCAPGDVALCMSNGSFDGLPRALLNALEAL